MLATVPTATLVGVDGRPVQVEVHVAEGLPGFTVIGLPDPTCREVRDRVRAALVSSGFRWPHKRITVNIVPPSITRTVGASLDLPIAVGLLVADEQLDPTCLADRAFLGELGLDGSLRPVPGALSLIDALDTPEVVVAGALVPEARLVGRHHIRVATDLDGLVQALQGERPWPEPPAPETPPADPPSPDVADVRGQTAARYALEVAAAGGHHLLLVGAPGSGKTMLARRLVGLLPDLQPQHAIEVTRARSAAGVSLPAGALVRRPPFRAPHHTASAVSLVGGATMRLQPGEISLANRGVLFLDELSEFSPTVLDNLRQPLEEGIIRVSRAATTATFPARVLLVGAMNPCPCGQGPVSGRCACPPNARLRYARRVTGPLLERFHLRVEVSRPDVDDLALPEGESTATVVARVAAARTRAGERGVATNAELPSWRVENETPLTRAATRLVERALSTGRLTGHGLRSVRRVALTVADLRGDDVPLGADHVSAALSLRATPSFARGTGPTPPLEFPHHT